MKTIIKIAVLVLALLMIVPCLAACNKGGKGDTTTKKQNNDDTPVDPYLEQVDMHRYNYKAFVRSKNTGNGAFYCEDFWIDKESGASDALSFAVIERNNRIEDEFNCTITQVDSTLKSQYEEMRTIFENNQTYELTIMMAIDVANCATSGYLTNLKSDENLKYINLDHESFDQNAIEQLSMGDTLYYISGDMNTSSLDNTIATIFNVDFYKQVADSMATLFDDDDFASPYTLVEEGKWTVENMLKIADANTTDVNSTDGALSYDNGDTIGYYMYTAAGIYYYYGAGMRLSEMNDGYIDFLVNSDESQEVYNKLFDMFNPTMGNNYPYGASGNRAKNFQSGQVLFADYILWDVRRVLYSADIDFAYGILPVATLEENADYHSVVYFQNCANLWALPYYRSNNEYAARLLYVMTVYSGEDDSTLDAYYMRTMYMEVAKDDGSRASLEIVRNSLVYDIVLLYTSEGGAMPVNFANMLNRIASATQKEFATYTSETNMEKAETTMQETLDKFNSWSHD